MKKYIPVFELFIAATTIAAFVDKFKGWNELVDRSSDIIIARCTSTLNGPERRIVLNGGIPTDTEVISVLKGNTKVGISRMTSSYWPYPGERFLLFANYHADQSFSGYSAPEEYRVVPLNHYFRTNMLTGKTPEQQIQWILDSRLHDLNDELARGIEEKKRLEGGLKVPTNSPAKTSVNLRENATSLAQAVQARSTTNVAPPALPSMVTNQVAQAIAKTNPYAGRVLEAWQAPLEFYGKVVDQNSNPVAGAQITFRWMEIPDNTGSRSSNTVSDSQGLFSLHGAKGPSLSILFSKDGYYSSHHGQMGFNYALGLEPISPDPQNPIVFLLFKKGNGERLTTLNRNFLVPQNGAPLSVNLVSGATNASLGGDFVVQCWTQNQGKRSNENYDWPCVITIPGGGLVSTPEEFPLFAPEAGYQPSIEINMPADRADWKDDVDLRFYYRLADGRYGRMTFSIIAHGQHFCMIDSVLNPTGSRNLEPAN